MSYIANEQQQMRNPQFYEQKANQLRLQNQILKRQLQNNITGYSIKKTFQPQTHPERMYSTVTPHNNYTFHQGIPVQRVIYNPVSRPIRPGHYPDSMQFNESQPQRMRTQKYTLIPQKQILYATEPYGYHYQTQRKMYMNQVQEEIIDLQTRGYKLEREASKLSSFIKDDLKDFVRDSNIHKECNYKEKYLRAIANRPRHFRFNM